MEILKKDSCSKITRPFLKWAGGKRQLLPVLTENVPLEYNTYFEPFVGAGALLFELQPSKAVINDNNAELINCYIVIRDHLDELLEDFKKHKNEKEYFYEIRERDRSYNFLNMHPVEKASRTIFLNKTCYNGLFRVNSRGYFNVPYGNYINPKYYNIGVLKSIQIYLKQNAINILNLDFEEAVKDAREGDFIYFDPPYHPLSETSSFTGYNVNGFNEEEQKRLKKVFDELTERRCKIMLSNSSTSLIKNLYKEYNIKTIQANRNINSNGAGRGKIDEALILNYN